MAGNKFGIPHGHALEVYRRAARMANVRIAGIDCHIGSQILETAPLDAALERVLELVERLRAEGIRLEHVDLGGGFGIRYRDEHPLDFRAYARHLATRLAGRGIALLPTFIAGADLQQGTLRTVLADYKAPELALYAIYPPNRHLSVKVRLLIDFLVERFGQRPYWDLVD